MHTENDKTHARAEGENTQACIHVQCRESRREGGFHLASLLSQTTKADVSKSIRGHFVGMSVFVPGLAREVLGLDGFIHMIRLGVATLTDVLASGETEAGGCNMFTRTDSLRKATMVS